MIRGIDAHIHLDMYEESVALRILDDLPNTPVQALVAVTRHLDSCKATKLLQSRFPDLVYAAYGYHPEQDSPSPQEQEELFTWILSHASETTAIGEVGLPYYLRHEAEEKGLSFDLKPYLDLLERFIILGKRLEKPLVLHAVYEDTDLVCDLLDKYDVKLAHFHWFKGSEQTIKRMIAKGYYISITPDVNYEAEIQVLAAQYPIDLIMAETDGPWPFEGPFAGQETHPNMILSVIQKIAQIKKLSIQETADILLRNTGQFYGLHIQ